MENLYISHTTEFVFAQRALPLQTTGPVEAVFTKPALHLQVQTLLPAACEQSALISHPPLFTLQTSTTMQKYLYISRTTQLFQLRALPLQTTGPVVAVFTKPPLHLHVQTSLPAAWEQSEFASQPPLFTLQTSRTIWKTCISVTQRNLFSLKEHYLCRRQVQ